MEAPRHAYLILAHNHPEQLRILLSLLDDGRNDVFVHLDANAPFGPEALEGSCRRSALHFIEPRFEIHWGGVSIMRAELALLRAAVSGGYAYYHLLSGQDLPIKDQDTIHTTESCSCSTGGPSSTMSSGPATTPSSPKAPGGSGPRWPTAFSRACS